MAVISNLMSGGRGRAFWAVADQGIVSLGNFATNILLARYLSLRDYGGFGMLLEVMLFLNSLQAALIVYPMSVKGAVADQQGLRQAATAALALSALLALPLGAALLGAGGTLGGLSLGAWAAVALICWQCQETVRRALMAHLRYRDSLAGDALSYLGQAALVFVLAGTGWLSVPSALGAMAFTSALAAILQARQVGLTRVSWGQVGQVARASWGLGCWLALANLQALITSGVYVWGLALFHGLEAAAVGQAFANLLKLTNPVSASVMGLIIPAGARARREEGVPAAMRVALLHGAHGAVLLAPYFAVLLLWPAESMRLVYGADSQFLHHAPLLRIMTVAFVCVYVYNVLLALLNSLERPRANFMLQATSGATTLAVGLPLTVFGGLTGALWGGLLAVLAALGMGAWMLWRLRREVQPEARSAAAVASAA